VSRWEWATAPSDGTQPDRQRARGEGDGGGTEGRLYRREHARSARNAEQPHDDRVARRAADGKPSQDPSADLEATWPGCRSRGESIGRKQRAREHAERDKHDRIDGRLATSNSAGSCCRRQV
jgi:hypothetical protein